MKVSLYHDYKLSRHTLTLFQSKNCSKCECILFLFCMLILSSLIGCGEKIKDHNIVLISLDTLRPDRLGCYGSIQHTSPHMDKLASQGILFLNARAQSSWTLPSHMSLFTSLYPSFHQVMTTDHCLSSHLITLTQILKKNGFKTAAFTEGGNLFKIYGFGRGFDIYGEKSRDIEVTFDQATGWLRSEAKEGKFFLFIHTYENHTPYLRNTLADPNKRGRFGDTLPVDQQLFDIMYGRLLPTPQEKEYVNSLYDSGVLYADSYVGKLLHVMEELDLMESTTLIILSDHGEDLWDHSISPAHGVTLYEDQLRVPLIIYDSKLPNQLKIGAPVQLIDILPTLLAIQQIPIPLHLQGENLLPLIYAKKASVKKIHFSEGTDYGPNRIAVIKDNYKYITIPKPSEVKRGLSLKKLSELEPGLEEHALFNLKDDPSEKNNLICKEPEKAQELQRIIEREYLAKSRNLKPISLMQNLLEKEKQRLKSLGYIR